MDKMSKNTLKNKLDNKVVDLFSSMAYEGHSNLYIIQYNNSHGKHINWLDIVMK